MSLVKDREKRKHKNVMGHTIPIPNSLTYIQYNAMSVHNFSFAIVALEKKLAFELSLVSCHYFLVHSQQLGNERGRMEGRAVIISILCVRDDDYENESGGCSMPYCYHYHHVHPLLVQFRAHGVC